MAAFRSLVAPVGSIALAAGLMLPGCKSEEPSNGDSKAGAAPNAGTGNETPRGGTGGASGGANAGGPASGGNGGITSGGGAGGVVTSSGGGGKVTSGGTGGVSTSAGRGGANTSAGIGGQAIAAGAGGSAGLGTAGMGPSGAGGSAGGNSRGPRKIIAIGDSITRATCWRAKLWQTLNGTHSGQFELVGTLQSDSGCNVAGYDQDNQGYSSSLLTEAVAGVTNARTCDPKCPTLDDFAAAFTTTKPDVALIHYGTNDVWNGKPTTDITAGYSALVDKLRAANPNVSVLLAKLIPMNVSDSTCGGCSCSSCSTAIPALNAAIDGFATSKATTASPIVVVDQFTGFDATADTRDGVHPNDSGSQKIAAKWAAALEPLF